MIGQAGTDGIDQRRNVGRVVRAVRVNEDQDIAAGLLDTLANGRALALSTVQDDPRAQGRGDVAGGIAAVIVRMLASSLRAGTMTLMRCWAVRSMIVGRRSAGYQAGRT